MHVLCVHVLMLRGVVRVLYVCCACVVRVLCACVCVCCVC